MYLNSGKEEGIFSDSCLDYCLQQYFLGSRLNYTIRRYTTAFCPCAKAKKVTREKTYHEPVPKEMSCLLILNVTRSMLLSNSTY